MKWRDWLEGWGMSCLKINTGILEMEWARKDSERKAAWELYTELLTRIATQYLAPDHDDEKTALDSIFKLFDLTRQTLRRHEGCTEFARIALVVLNQVTGRSPQSGTSFPSPAPHRSASLRPVRAPVVPAHLHQSLANIRRSRT